MPETNKQKIKDGPVHLVAPEYKDMFSKTRFAKISRSHH